MAKLTMEHEFEYLFNGLDLNKDWDCIAIQKCIKNIILSEGFFKYTVNKKVYTPDGGNYLGVLCEINIKGKTATDDKEINLFLKIITPGEQMTFLSMPGVYKNELFFYCELSKIFAELQNEVGLPQEDRYKTVKSYEESNSSVIILKNMVKKGYKTNYRMNCITLKYAELAVKQLAKFHALSFVLEDRRPEYFDNRIKPLKQPFKLNKEFNDFIQSMCEIALNYLDEDSSRKFKNFVPKFAETYVKLLTTECGRDVLCHGDYRANNILMKEVDGEVVDVIPIDYQIMYYGCPILDFIYLIFPSTDQNFRDSHLLHLKELYYDTLRTFLKYFGLDSANVYPKHEFNRHYKEKLEYGLTCSVVILPFIMANENDIPDVTKNTLTSLNISVDDRYRDRITGIVKDFIKWGYL